jgi:hypothetical protein
MFENEKIIETKICKHCGVAFDITDKELEFYEKISPVFPSLDSKGESRLEKYLIPCPTLCPDCRQQRRMVFRNFMKLYTIKSSNSDTTILSMYKP